MPTSLFSEMDRGTNGGGAGASLEDQRALQLAFELSMLGLEGSSGCPGAGTGNGTTNDPDPLQNTPAVFEEARSKKSQNMTECVPVPSSEHVAEIVGRQGKFLFYKILRFIFRLLTLIACLSALFHRSIFHSIDCSAVTSFFFFLQLQRLP